MNPAIAKAINQVFAPNLKLLRQVGKIIPQAAEQGIAEVQGAEKRSLVDIVKAAQDQGMDFKGFDREGYNRLFGVGYKPALANLKTLPQAANLKLSEAVNNLAFARGQGRIETGNVLSDLAQQEELSKARIAADLEAQRINAAQSAARGDELNPAEEAELDVQAFVEAAMQNPKLAKPGYRERVQSFLVKKYGGVLRTNKIKDMIFNDYFPDNWEDIYGLRD